MSQPDDPNAQGGVPPVALIAVPLVVASVTALLIEMPAAAAAGLFALASVVALLAANKAIAEGAGGNSDGLAIILGHIARGDSAAALDAARSQNVLSSAAQQAMEELAEASQNGGSAHVRAPLEAAGRELTSLSESISAEKEQLQTVQDGAKSNQESFSQLAEHMDELARSAEESSASIIEMVAINNEVRTNVHTLATSVEETTTAIEEMTFSSKEVAKNIEELSTAAEETAASMNEMDVSISQVETNATETSRLSGQVTEDAETGVSAINTTIRGIDKIKDSSREASDVISNLGQKINQIGDILNVIDDVAEQTNLLALNAAIIAAQAGEHGRGFAVVADEIKALAERTGASTKEIADLVTAIQDASRNAVSVMQSGVEDVEEGVRLGHNAEDALRKILQSAKQSTLMIQAIAQATVEQAKGSKQVTDAIGRVAETVQQIAYATAEQAKGAEHIMQSAERMKVITQQVERSADEQGRGGDQVTSAIERISEVAERISNTHESQRKFGARIIAAAAESSESNEQAVGLARELERRIGKAAAALD